MVPFTATKDSSPAERLACDVAMIGGGIMSATFGTLLNQLQPDWSIQVFERLGNTALESSNPWNNAGTGHAGMCELNYTKVRPDGTVDIAKAVEINEQFQQSRQLWSALFEKGVLGTDPSAFINATPHMTFVHDADNVEFLRRRWEALKANALFASMEFSDDPEQLRAWAPLLVEGRDPNQPVAATYDVEGTDVNFGSLTRQMLSHLKGQGTTVHTDSEVIRLRRDGAGWKLVVRNTQSNLSRVVQARYVFVGAGGYALKMLQMAGLPEVDGYGLFPVSGAFLTTTDAEIVNLHGVKAYGKGPVGSPPMSTPHLDARIIDGARCVLFGPFAGTNPKYLKRGSALDLPKSLRLHNVLPMVQVGLGNIDLVKYLISMVFMPPSRQLQELHDYAPSAHLDDWHMITAGQRAQIIKKDASGKGTLQFGTEAIVSADRTMSAVLGASPGASTAVPIILDLLQRSFPDRLPDWEPKIRALIPSYGKNLSDDPQQAHETLTRTARILGVAPPTW